MTNISEQAVAPFRTPISEDTSSDEVFKLALTWITTCDNTCKCAKKVPAWYPTRLIDIRALKSELFLSTRREQYTGSKPRGSETLEKLDDVTVKLVERDRDDPSHSEHIFSSQADNRGQPNNLYVTLSHCWGASEHYTLDPRTEAELKSGIKLEKLPKTFRDAIMFASQLHNVGWIWIDSLCIFQSGQKSEEDWLHEASLMQKVYQESYLNISATAASDSGQGLHFPRDHMTLWEDEVNLNVDGLPGLRHEDRKSKTYLQKHIQNSEVVTETRIQTLCWWAKWWPKQWIRLSNESVQSPSKTATAQIDWGGDKPVTLTLPEPKGVRRCVLTDAANWDEFVNEAPVNKRAWVLQERLLAPRVLHFCNGKIAWECRQFTRAEGHPTGLRKFRVEGGRILPEVPIKGLDPFKHGSELRKIRLRGIPEPDPELASRDLYAFELWARMVEMYSKMRLTKARDKLIALSGIAELMSKQILGTETKPATYVAGLWKRHLESQLLWKVEPVFCRNATRRTFVHPSRRPRDEASSSMEYIYRAPSFSWASVDAEDGSGIVYGEVTDRDLLIELQEGEDAVVIEKESESAFGLVKRGHVLIWGSLRKIKLKKEDNGRHSWRLVDRNFDTPIGVYLDKETHRNVYLDSPEDDDELHSIFSLDNIYCVPAAYGERSEAKGSKYMMCLLLQLAEDDKGLPKDWDETKRQGTYRRIGLTKLSTWADKETYVHILTKRDSDMEPRELPHRPHQYRETTGQHLIRII